MPFASIPKVPEWLDDLKASVLHVRSGRGHGGAFVWSVSPSGVRVLTNHHVVARRNDVKLAREDGSWMEARVVASDPALDLALLETKASLPFVRVGDSRALRLGELVFALGHPWGRPWVLTHGVVSGLGEVRFGRAPREFVRSDVRLAPGNSGGPLVNASGEVIGVNSMVWGGRLGVAVPAHVAHAWLANLDAPKVKLGVGAASARLDGRRVVIVTFVENASAAREAGLRVGDVILAANGELLPHPEALRAYLTAAGELTLDVWRGGATSSVVVRLREARAA
ncbi:S1C family serine protease [Deinococcus yavapaiensis]|uniref:Serine protease Do n=1 Tax=Deinococcus yavapaiensis KR-236 TaxID=694435 RepID=A0A318S319_9DEIO|nr:trypsin-like peptidase domain-containing protein [Deinococcus yavapaiensis]PYE51815.1 serine protease Do [Deinococcus yavapaiensis KR-236]